MASSGGGLVAAYRTSPATPARSRATWGLSFQNLGLEDLVDRGDERLGRGEAVLGALLERPFDDGARRSRDIGRKWRRRILQVGSGGVGRVEGGKTGVSGEHFVQHDTQGKGIDPTANRGAM